MKSRISRFCKTAFKIYDVNKISLGSLSLYNDGRAYKLHVSLNISHSSRCLNIGSVSHVPCQFNAKNIIMHSWKLYWNKKLSYSLFSHFFVVPQKVLWRSLKPERSMKKKINWVFSLRLRLGQEGLKRSKKILPLHAWQLHKIIWRHYVKEAKLLNLKRQQCYQICTNSSSSWSAENTNHLSIYQNLDQSFTLQTHLIMVFQSFYQNFWIP